MRVSRTQAILGTTVILGLAAPAALAASLPKLPDASGHLGSGQFKVKPASILISGDGSFYFDGRKKSHNRAAPLSWSSWTATAGHGTGFAWINNCKPNCAAGTFHQYPVKLEVSQPKHEGGHFIFTQMTVTYTGTRPAHSQKTSLMYVEHHGGVWFWAAT